MANFEIQCPIKLQISDETADLCAKVLEMYIQDQDKVVATLMQPGPEGIKKYVRILDENEGEFEEADGPLDAADIPNMPAPEEYERELSEYKRKRREDELQVQPENKKEMEEIGWQLSKLEQ